MWNTMGTLLAVCSFWASASVAVGQVTDEKKWIDEKTWPRFAINKPLEINKEDDSLTKLLKLRYNAVLEEFATRYIHWVQNAATLNEVEDAAQRLSLSRLELLSSSADRITYLKDKHQFFRYVEEQAQIMSKKNTTKSYVELKYAKYCRLNSEIELTREEIKSSQPGRGK